MQVDSFFGPPPRSVPRVAPPAAPSAPLPPAPVRTRPGLLVGAALTGTVAAVLLLVVPARGAPAALHPVEHPAPADAGWGPAWTDDSGRPARWDPCTPIPYVVNPRWMPDAGRADLAEALRRISAVSGLQFVDEGDTDELPRRDREGYQPDRYGERWAPLLVAWVPPALTDVEIGGTTQGMALAMAVPNDGGGSIVTGQVVLNADRRLVSGFGPGTTDGEVLLHELAHAVGLGHVDDPTQVMYFRTTNTESSFGAGDRAGLTALGAAAGCHPAPAARPGW